MKSTPITLDRSIMKKGFFVQSFLCLLTVSCTVQDLDTQETGVLEKGVFYATLESYADPETRIHIDENIKILWDADDRISIFDKSTYNQQYRFLGKTGDNAGGFEKVSESAFVTGGDYPLYCAVYPYQKATSIDNYDVLHLTLPKEQEYRADSFGKGANTMVAVSEDNLLRFKNAGGFLVLKFFGENVSVSSVTLEGLNNERLSGKAFWQPRLEAFPEITMDDSDPEGGTSITLKCDGILLGTTKETATVFWLVVPPTKFPQGFKLTVKGLNGEEFVKQVNNPDILDRLYVERNGILRIGAIEVVFPSQS